MGLALPESAAAARAGRHRRQLRRSRRRLEGGRTRWPRAARSGPEPRPPRASRPRNRRRDLRSRGQLGRRRRRLDLLRLRCRAGLRNFEARLHRPGLGRLPLLAETLPGPASVFSAGRSRRLARRRDRRPAPTFRRGGTCGDGAAATGEVAARPERWQAGQRGQWHCGGAAAGEACGDIAAREAARADERFRQRALNWRSPSIGCSRRRRRRGRRSRQRRETGAKLLGAVSGIRSVGDQALRQLLALGRGHRPGWRRRHRREIRIIRRLPGSQVSAVRRRLRIRIVAVCAGQITPSVDRTACAEPEQHRQNRKAARPPGSSSWLRRKWETGILPRASPHSLRISPRCRPQGLGMRSRAAQSIASDVLDPEWLVTTFDRNNRRPPHRSSRVRSASRPRGTAMCGTMRKPR